MLYTLICIKNGEKFTSSDILVSMTQICWFLEQGSLQGTYLEIYLGGNFSYSTRVKRTCIAM